MLVQTASLYIASNLSWHSFKRSTLVQEKLKQLKNLSQLKKRKSQPLNVELSHWSSSKKSSMRIKLSLICKKFKKIRSTPNVLTATKLS
jgi:hypothetical protein